MNNKEKLRNAGLRPTKQRMLIADILLNGLNRHFTAENLQDEIAEEHGYEVVRHVHQLFVRPKK